MKAVWNELTLAESDTTEVYNEQHFFPPDTINTEFFLLSDAHSIDKELGKASYFHLQNGSEDLLNAAWFYSHPGGSRKKLKNYVTFSKDIKIIS